MMAYGIHSDWLDIMDEDTKPVTVSYSENLLISMQQQTGLDADCWKKCKPESGCVETDQNGNEIPPKKVRVVRTGLEFAPYSPGGRLFEKPKPKVPIGRMLKVSTPIFVLSLPRSKLIKVSRRSLPYFWAITARHSQS